MKTMISMSCSLLRVAVAVPPAHPSRHFAATSNPFRCLGSLVALGLFFLFSSWFSGGLRVEFEFYYTPQAYPPDPSGDHLSPAHA